MNDHIKDYCKEFILSKENPHFAIFINGEWGAGKTYLVNKILEDLYQGCQENKKQKPTINKSQVLKISLFGVKSTEDIDLKIYQGVHPFLSSSGAKLMGAVFRTALKLGTSFDFTGDGVSDFCVELGGVSKEDGKKQTKINKKFLIVDDLERANLSPQQIFAYFSEIITESDIKVIFIGNEEKIANKNDEEKKEFTQIKEKTIGIEFKVELEYEEALDTFLTEFNIDKDFYKKKTIDIATTLKCRNLRVLRQGLYNVSLLMDMLQEELEQNDKEKIYEIFLVLYIQKNMGQLTDTKVNISEILAAYFENGMSYEEYSTTKKQNKDTYSNFLRSMRHYTLLSSWEKIIFEGYYNKEWLRKNYKEEKSSYNAQEEQSNLFKLIENWRNLNKEDFESLIKKVFEEFDNKEYLHPGEILLFATHMIVFAEWQLIPEKSPEIKEKVKEFIKNYNKNIFFVPEWSMLELGYKGYGFSTEIQEIAEFKKELKDLNDKKKVEFSKKEICNELSSLTDEKVDEFCRNIFHVNGSNKYYQQPILSYLDMNKFYEKLKLLSFENQRKIIHAFAERYGIIYSNGKILSQYKPDYDNLKQLIKLYKSDSSDTLYNPQALFLVDSVKQLEEMEKYFESQ